MLPTPCKLTLTVLLALLVHSLSAVGAAAPEAAPTSELQLTSISQQGTDPTLAGIEEESSLCQGDPSGESEPALEPSPGAAPSLAANCCQALCDQVCGVNQACFCRRCVVLGCEL